MSRESRSLVIENQSEKNKLLNVPYFLEKIEKIYNAALAKNNYNNSDDYAVLKELIYIWKVYIYGRENIIEVIIPLCLLIYGLAVHPDNANLIPLVQSLETKNLDYPWDETEETGFFEGTTPLMLLMKALSCDPSNTGLIHLAHVAAKQAPRETWGKIDKKGHFEGTSPLLFFITALLHNLSNDSFLSLAHAILSQILTDAWHQMIDVDGERLTVFKYILNRLLIGTSNTDLIMGFKTIAAHIPEETWMEVIEGETPLMYLIRVLKDNVGGDKITLFENIGDHIPKTAWNQCPEAKNINAPLFSLIIWLLKNPTNSKLIALFEKIVTGVTEQAWMLNQDNFRPLYNVIYWLIKSGAHEDSLVLFEKIAVHIPKKLWEAASYDVLYMMLDNLIQDPTQQYLFTLFDKIIPSIHQRAWAYLGEMMPLSFLMLQMVKDPSNEGLIAVFEKVVPHAPLRAWQVDTSTPLDILGGGFSRKGTDKTFIRLFRKILTYIPQGAWMQVDGLYILGILLFHKIENLTHDDLNELFNDVATHVPREGFGKENMLYAMASVRYRHDPWRCPDSMPFSDYVDEKLREEQKIIKSAVLCETVLRHVPQADRLEVQKDIVGHSNLFFMGLLNALIKDPSSSALIPLLYKITEHVPTEAWHVVVKAGVFKDKDPLLISLLNGLMKDPCNTKLIIAFENISERLSEEEWTQAATYQESILLKNLMAAMISTPMQDKSLTCLALRIVSNLPADQNYWHGEFGRKFIALLLKRGHLLDQDKKAQLQRVLLKIYMHNRTSDGRRYFHSCLPFFFRGYSKDEKNAAAQDLLQSRNRRVTGASKQGLLGKIARLC